MASIEMARGDFDSAVVLFEQPPGTHIFFYPYMLGRAYLGSGQTQKAIDEFQNQLSNYGTGRVHFNPWGIKLHYHLGIAYEQAGQYPAAIVACSPTC